jgi:hypothetical protein
LIKKNDTRPVVGGELQIEGSIKQLKHLLKYNLIVIPACLFDNSIKVDIQVMYAENS